MTPSTRIAEIQDLVNLLRNGDHQSVLDQLEDLQFSEEDLEPYAHFSPHHYTRNCILRTDELELILLCWEPGQLTPVHCHDEQECWVKVLRGSFTERQYSYENEILRLTEETDLAEGDVTYMQDPELFHCLANKDERGMSLHLYMGPIERCRVYDSAEKEMSVKELHYHSFEGQLLN